MKFTKTVTFGLLEHIEKTLKLHPTIYHHRHSEFFNAIVIWINCFFVEVCTSENSGGYTVRGCFTDESKQCSPSLVPQSVSLSPLPLQVTALTRQTKFDIYTIDFIKQNLWSLRNITDSQKKKSVLLNYYLTERDRMFNQRHLLQILESPSYQHLLPGTP